MSLAVSFASTVTVAETITGNAPFADGPHKTVTHTLLNTAFSLGPATTPPVSKFSGFQKALSGGAATIDLTALTGTNSAAVDFTGLIVQVAKFRNPSGNANPIKIVVGASNGYGLSGADFAVTLKPGEEWTYKGAGTGVTVAGGAKTLDLTGTASQALDCYLVAG